MFLSATSSPGLSAQERRVLWAVGLGTFIIACDGSAVNAVLPLIQDAYRTSISTVGWVTLAELLATSGLLLGFGRLGDLWGHRLVYLAGFGVFIIGSLLCTMAPGVTPLIAFRVVQGSGIAMLSANSPAILVKHSGSCRRGKVLGLRASLTYLGLIVGPVIGGWLAQVYGWRAVFYMQLGAGLVGLKVAQRLIPVDRNGPSGRRFDLPGAATWLWGLAAFLFALNRGQVWGWTSVPVQISLLSSAILLAAFVIVEWANPDAMMDLKLFTSPSFSAASAALVLSFLCGYALTFLLPFYLTRARHTGSVLVGVVLGAHALVRAVVAPLSGALSDKIGARVPGIWGMGTLAFGLVLLCRLDENSSIAGIVTAVLIAGLGIGIFVSPNNSMLMGAAPRSNYGVAAGILATSRTLGMSMGVGLAGAIASSSADRPHSVITASSLVRSIDSGFAVAAVFAILGASICAAVRSEVARSSFE
jgi:EmrB/QacA subfamily drug resistance transporter